MNMFTKDFLDELQDAYGRSRLDHVDILMFVGGLSFHDAILGLARFAQITPRYVELKDSKEDKIKRAKNRIDRLVAEWEKARAEMRELEENQQVE